MVDTRLLNDVVKERGVKKTWLSEKVGCCRPRLDKILRGENVTLAEIDALSEALNLNASLRNRIFFANNVE